MERTLSLILRGGVVLSSVLISIGLIWMLGPALGTHHSLHEASLAAPPEAFALIRVGLAVLLSTPAARVVASLWLFGKQRDWAFVAMTAWVLMAMGAGLLLA